jgi:hypothetical protein
VQPQSGSGCMRVRLGCVISKSCHWVWTEQRWQVLSLVAANPVTTVWTPPPPPRAAHLVLCVVCAMSLQGADAPAANGHAAAAASQRSAADLANGGRQSSVSPHGDAVLSPTSMLQQVHAQLHHISNCCSFWVQRLPAQLQQVQACTLRCRAWCMAATPAVPCTGVCTGKALLHWRN